jgi:peptidoglycan hydrolase-like protein with peptidoglycan-binding domain
MLRRYRLISIVGALLFCAVTAFFLSTSAAQAASLPGGGNPPPPRQQSVRACPAPPPFGARDRAGDNRVQTLQRELARRGYKDSQGHILRVSGVFDRDTQNALKRFESDHRLRVDGVPGPTVWRLLSVCR